MNRKPQSPIKRDILTRVRYLYAFFFLVGLAIFVRMVCIQFFSPVTADFAERMSSRIFTQKTIRARRGDILLRDGEPLATTIRRYQVVLDYSAEGLDSALLFRRNADSLAGLLGAFFQAEGYGAAHFRKLLRTEYAKRHSRPHYQSRLLPREVDLAEWERLRKFPILNWNMGMVYSLSESYKRIYPQGSLALRTVGKAEVERPFGIEAAWDSLLRGEDGRVRRQRIAHGFTGNVADTINLAPVNGLDVVTTLDRRIQEITDMALRRQAERIRPLWATAVVMEVSTGEILALSNLTDNGRGAFTERYDNAFTRLLNPGSTFKLAMLLALVEERGWELDRTYTTGKMYEFPRTERRPPLTVRDDHPADSFSMLDAVAHSSNIWFARAVEEAYGEDPRPLIDYLRELHLDAPVGLSALGERSPTFRTPDHRRWKEDNMLLRMAYGYTNEYVPIQIATLYNAVANEGCMVAPMLVRELRRDGETVERFRPTVLNERICSASSLRKVRRCLDAVASRGTGHLFFARDSALFRVAAKTGTAQISTVEPDATGRMVRKEYRDGYYLSSMAAYFPSDKPKYTLFVAMETQRGRSSTYYGAWVAGPVIKEIAYSLFNLETAWQQRVDDDAPERYPARMKGGSIEALRETAAELDMRSRHPSRHGWGSAQVEQGTVRIEEVPLEAGKMPRVIGMGLRDALYLLERSGLRVRFTGQGRVVSQSIGAGASIRSGQNVNIVLK